MFRAVPLGIQLRARVLGNVHLQAVDSALAAMRGGPPVLGLEGRLDGDPAARRALHALLRAHPLTELHLRRTGLNCSELRDVLRQLCAPPEALGLDEEGLAREAPVWWAGTLEPFEGHLERLHVPAGCQLPSKWTSALRSSAT